MRVREAQWPLSRPHPPTPPPRWQASSGAINLANFNEFDMQLDMAMPFALDELPAPDQWMAAASQTMARRQDITLLDSEMGDSGMGTSSSSRRMMMGGGGLEASGLSEDWAETEFDPRDEDVMGDEGEEDHEEEPSSIEFARDADGTPSGRGARGLSISGAAALSEGRPSLSASKGDGPVALEDDYGEDIEPLAPVDDEEEGRGGEEE